MTKKLVGLFASVALLSSGLALANDDKGKHQQTQSGQQVGGDAIGGAGAQDPMGSTAQQGQIMGEKQVTGTVVKSSADMLHLRTDQGILSVKVNKDTKFQDATIKRARDLKEGQQVRASFDIKGTDNVAKSISLDIGSTGGSGLEPDTGINQDMGGSGLDQNMGGTGTGDVGGTGTGDVGGSGSVGGSGDQGH